MEAIHQNFSRLCSRGRLEGKMSWLRKRSEPIADHDASGSGAASSSGMSSSSWVRPRKRLTRRHTPLDTDPPKDRLTRQMLQTGTTLEQFGKYVVHKGVVKMGRTSFKGNMNVACMFHGSAWHCMRWRRLCRLRTFQRPFCVF